MPFQNDKIVFEAIKGDETFRSFQALNQVTDLCGQEATISSVTGIIEQAAIIRGASCRRVSRSGQRRKSRLAG